MSKPLFVIVFAAISGAPLAFSAAPVSGNPLTEARICPFTPAELRTALGLELQTGTAGKPLNFRGGASYRCVYAASKSGSPGLAINQTVMDDPKQTAGFLDSLAGKSRKIAGDPDGALLQEGQGDMTDASLHYIRQGSIVELRVALRPTHAGYAEMQQKLTRLRRVP
jgi:hypothetical protein